MVFARTSGKDGDAHGITCFVIPADTPGVKVEEYLWTFNMPTDHPRVSYNDVWAPEDSYWGQVGKGLGLGQSFVHQNRIRQAASSLGAAVYCINESVKYAMERRPFGKPLSDNQAIQWPLVELATQAERLRLLIRKTAWQMDRMPHAQVERELSDKVSMCNYWGNRLCCEAADRAMQVHGGMGYSRHKAFEHIYRHHRRYRITEGSEEIQMRKVAAFLFGNKAGDPLLQRHLRRIAAQGLQTGDVGKGFADIARLHRQHDLFRCPSKGLLEDLDHPHQADRPVVADVEDPVRALVARMVQHPDHTVDDVIDEGEIARHSPLAKHLDRLTREDLLGKAEIGHVRPAPWTVHGEEAQAADRKAVEVGVGLAHQLAGTLRGRIE